MSNKEMIIEAIRKLPDESSVEEIVEEVVVLAAIRRGEEEADAGRTISHEEVKKRIQKCLSR